MEIILLERVEKLGAMGDVVNVKDGFARNYLLPLKKALRSNEANRKVFENNRERLVNENAARRGEAQKAAGGVDGAEVVLIRAASNTGQLYGSVAVRDIIDALDAQEIKVAKAMVVLAKPIKALGVYDVHIALHPEVSVTVKVNVARSPEEAELQQKGIDVISQMFEDEQAELAVNALTSDDELPDEDAPDDGEAEVDNEAANVNDDDAV